MGYLLYGTSRYHVQIDDRALAHLKVVMLSLMRSSRSFELCLQRSTDMGGGRESFWVCPTTEICFRITAARPHQLNDAWLRAIFATTESPGGLRIVDEPADLPTATTVLAKSELTPAGA